MNPELKNVLVQHYAGSIAYGTNLPTSDVDIRGIFCADREFITMPWYNCDELTLENEEDGKLYELTKFMQLYTNGNPNIIETLFVDESDIITSDEGYSLFKEHAYDLLSKKVAFTFSGYAMAQMKRIKGHDRWLNNPRQVEPPKQKEFVKLVQNFLPNKILPSNLDLEEFKDNPMVHYGNNIFGILEKDGMFSEDTQSTVFNALGDFNVSIKQNSQSDIALRDKPILLIRYIESEYTRCKDDHANYWKWKNNRNAKRHELEEKFGYDTKHGMHLVRLLRMGEEILKGEGVLVKRPDAEELLAIRAGEWKYEDMMEWAEEKDVYIRNELYNSSTLPKKPNMKLATKVLTELQDMYWTK